MRKWLFVVHICCVSALIYGQAPHAFNYQAVARDGSGTILSEQSVSFRISILQGGITGTPVYVETHLTTTNELGLVNLIIGEGMLVSGDMTSIDWGSDAYFTKVEMDPAGGTAYIDMGGSQLLSVPYALDAAKVEQHEFDSLKTVEYLNIGNGLKIGQIYELNGMTDDAENYVWMDLPEGMNAINTRVLDVAIYMYVFMGFGVYYGLGSQEPSGTVGYWLGREEGVSTGTIRIKYPDEVKNKPFRVTLMKVEDSVVIE